MKKRVIALFLLLTLLFSLTSCDISKIFNWQNTDQPDNGENTDNESSDDNNDHGCLYEIPMYIAQIEFDKQVFEAEEEISAELFFGHYLSPPGVTKYYDIYLIDHETGEEYLLRHVDKPTNEEDYDVKQVDYFDDRFDDLIFNHSESITIPREFLKKLSGKITVEVSVPLIEKPPVDTRDQPISFSTLSGFYTREAIAISNFSYTLVDNELHISTEKSSTHLWKIENANAEATKHRIFADHTLSPDTSYFKIENSGYEKNNVEIDFYFGRHFHGSAEQHKELIANIGRASIYVENDKGNRSLLAQTEENYISEKYRTVWSQYSIYETIVSVNYNNDSFERITIPEEFIEGERGILFLSVWGYDMSIEGAEEEKISEIPLQYTVNDGRVYLSRKFLMHRDESSNLDFFLDEIVTEEEALAAEENTESVEYKFTNCEEGKRVRGILIKDESASIYGLNIYSTADEFSSTLESLGYEVGEITGNGLDFKDFPYYVEDGWSMVAYRNNVKILIAHYDYMVSSYYDLSIGMAVNRCYIYICCGNNYDLCDTDVYSS